MTSTNFYELPGPGDRYTPKECLASGVYGKVYVATDTQASNKSVAIKVQKLNEDSQRYLEREYVVLRDLSSHANLPDFFGIYLCTDEIWFVMELCEGGSVSNLVNGLLAKNRRMAEEHIAYILKETVKALVFLHQNHVMHRDVKASNILLTKEGEVRLADFGFSHALQDTFDKTGSCLGCPCWMAPELIACTSNEAEGYGSRTDVWALGITAIELGDGKPPYYSMHPTRALFQIVTNPPPTLSKPFYWSDNYIDFINECLVKNPEHRPFVVELIEHPFMEQVPENNYHLTLEIKILLENLRNEEQVKPLAEEVVIERYLKKDIDGDLELMHVEDLASLDEITEETVLRELEARSNRGDSHTFVGDILLILNPNETKDIYGKEFHEKYTMKSQSENAPHIYTIADSAYQNALHHIIPQKIVLAGESGSGKTTNYLHLVNHLLYLGENININTQRLKNAIKLIHALTTASTPINDYSTRCIMKTDFKYGATGKITGAIFDVQQLEKWRVSTIDGCKRQGNFHMLYYLYYGLKNARQLEIYKLDPDCQYRCLQQNDDDKNDNKEKYVNKFKKIMKIFEEFEISGEDIDTILTILSAVLVLGEINFCESEDAYTTIDNREAIDKLGTMLGVDPKILEWALINYCLVYKGVAVRKKNTVAEAIECKNALANILYSRLVDYVVSSINNQLSLGRAIFGEKYSIQIFDYFGFECLKRNHLSQFLINCLNEELQFHYLQRIFAWERMDSTEEEINCEPYQFFDNKETLDLLLNKTTGLLSYIDEASKQGHKNEHVLDLIQQHNSRHVYVSGPSEFSVAHYTGRLKYDVKEMPEKNRDFLPPEITETLRQSKNKIIQLLFTNKLNKTGNLIVALDNGDENNRTKSSSDESDEGEKPKIQYSQTKKMRTAASIFKSLSLNLLKELSIGSGSGGTHFVRCIRTDLKNSPESYNTELIRQQLRALAVVETAQARQKGYPHRVRFAEFLRRYKFLAFDYDENVDITRDNCRLLLIRLKMEGWAIGKSKVFLKYHNEEYLSRLYENQIRKIVKIQSILRRFLAKCKTAQQKRGPQQGAVYASQEKPQMTEDEAASVIQRAYKLKEANMRNIQSEFGHDYKILDGDTCKFIKPYATKWQSRSIFHVLLQYRAMQLQDLFNFGQQIHFFNLLAFHNLQNINKEVDLDAIDCRASTGHWLGEARRTVLKVPLHLKDIPYYDTTKVFDLTSPGSVAGFVEDAWDTPYRWREHISDEDNISDDNIWKSHDDLINLPYTRDPSQPLSKLPANANYQNGEQLKMGTQKLKQQCEQNERKKYQTGQQSRDNRTKESKNKENNAVCKKINYCDRNVKNMVIKPAPRTKIDFSDVNSNAMPANKDFEFIKGPKPCRQKNADPVAELRKMSKQNQNATESEDDPPFNFRGMLRKTNYIQNYDSPVAEIERYNPPAKKVIAPENYQKKINNKADYVGKKIATELAPGIFIEGIVVDL